MRKHILRPKPNRTTIRRTPRKLKSLLLNSSLVVGRTSPQVLTSISSILSRKQNDRVFLVGGGPSLKNFNFQSLEKEDTICVNSSVFDVPQPNFFITKDYTFLKKYLVPCLQTGSKAKENWNFAMKIFVACYADGNLHDIDGKIVDIPKKISYDLRPVDWIIKNDKQWGISPSLDDFRCGVDSGYGALQLAVILRYKEVYLLGYDMCIQDKLHYHDNYGKKSDKWFQKKLTGYIQLYVEAFREISKSNQTKVLSCSSISQFNQIIPYIGIEEVLR